MSREKICSIEDNAPKTKPMVKKKMIEIKQLNPLLQYCLIHGGHLAEVLNARKDTTKNKNAK